VPDREIVVDSAAVSATVAVDVEARIVELVEAHRDELVALVDRELDRALEALVVERIEARNGATIGAGLDPNGSSGAGEPSNDASSSDASDPNGSTAPTSLCESCGERPRVVGRRVCQRCRGRRRRERRALAAAGDMDGPRSGPEAQSE
jgi:hypothetical protein